MYNTITPNIKGGCRQLVNYLEKEESLSRDFATYLDKESEREKGFFFNDQKLFIEKDDVVVGIDSNCKGLKLNENRFFSLTINPSEREVKHLEKLAEKQIEEYRKIGVDLCANETPAQIKDAYIRDMLAQYAVNGMDKYAANFGRDGINSAKDLVWFGRVEKDRYWKHTSTEVRHNSKIDRQIKKLEKEPNSYGRNIEIERLKNKYILESHVRKGGKNIPIREMMPKSGNNYHIHIIVSRKDRTQKISLSPLAKARKNDKHTINDITCKIGFDRNNFTQQLEASFDGKFNYSRAFFESYEGRKTMKETPELYKAKEAEYNAKLGDLKTKTNETYTQNSVEKTPKNSVKNAMQNFADQAGFKEIRNEYRPYKDTAQVGYNGYKIIASKQNGKQHIAKMSIKTTKLVTKGMGVPAAANPYMALAGIAMSFVSQISKGDRGD